MAYWDRSLADRTDGDIGPPAEEAGSQQLQCVNGSAAAYTLRHFFIYTTAFFTRPVNSDKVDRPQEQLLNRQR
ncbi:hypothetical protein KTT_56080 [Tengunoibacter tsumagoiensis]|uniref:Uncharacterized protein n=1 Tax=Tengunoibacter tsumagoiensis TaxID=2014871 RepID=A0A402A9E5_9CHLR|nr:hypothetical protein KTT_56080 [Tengunoibacter tsumagoiensis]